MQSNSFKTDHNCEVAEFLRSQLKSQFTAYGTKDINCMYNHLQHNVEYVHDNYFFQMLYIDIMNQEGANIMIAYPGEKKKCKQITRRPNLEAAEKE